MSVSRRSFLVKSAVFVAASSGIVQSLRAFAADAPLLLTYQGRLTDLAGLPRNGSLPMSFRIVDQSGIPQPSGTPWGETHATVSVINGFFTVALGSVTPLTSAIFTDAPQDSFGAAIFIEVFVIRRSTV